jgi:hypothetical protein
MITVDFNFILDKSNIGIGNNMFQYCICRIIAEKNGYNFHIKNDSSFTEIKIFFPDLDLGVQDGEIKYHYSDTEMQIFNEEIFNIPDFTKIIGYFQSEKYFLGYEHKIKSWFKLEMDEKTKNILELYRKDQYCYVHFRGGDYKNNSNLLPKIYYDLAMQEMAKEKDIKFLVITDDLDLAKLYFPSTEIISNDTLTDFKCLYFSKYSIISNSSFSWWTSWLSDKEKSVAPSKWLNYNKDGEIWHPFDIKTKKFIYV